MKKEYLRTADVEAAIKAIISGEEQRWEKLCDRLEIVEDGGEDKRGLTEEQLYKRLTYSGIRERAYRKILSAVIDLSYKED